MLDSQIVNILQEYFIEGLTVTDIITKLPDEFYDYQSISDRCMKLVDKGIIKSYKNNNDAVVYKII